MVRDPTRRIAKYSAKIDPTVIKQRFESQAGMMVDQVTQKFAELADLEEKAKAILDYEGVPTIEIPFYLDFVRQCYSLKTSHPATTAQREAALLKQVWVARGLKNTVLSRLASDLFGMTV